MTPSPHNPAHASEVGPAAGRAQPLSASELAWLWDLAKRLHACPDLAAAEVLVALAEAETHGGGPAIAAARAETVGPALANLRDRERLRSLALRDPLTGLCNRRILDDELPRLFVRAATLGEPLALAMLDLDRFRDYNERHGHPAGDMVLMTIGGLLQGFRRELDLACRYGGEEFMLIMPATAAAEATSRLEPLRQAIAEAAIHHEGRRLAPITCSIGVAGFPAHGGSAAAVVAAADEALYLAKRSGRDHIRLAADGREAR